MKNKRKGEIMIRMYDIIVTNPGYESQGVQVTNLHNIYEASDLGGGFERGADGSITSTNNSISFRMIFKTDVNNTGYEKYLQTVTDMAKGSMVWLRYAIPIGKDYKYAYRPGYISGVTKTEASYNQASLVETVTVQTVGGWFDLCVFTPAQAAVSLAYVPQRRKVFSEYPDNWKTVPRVFPYWYRSVMQELVDTSRGTWFNRWGSVLQQSSDVYTMFAIHAPSMSISDDERAALSDFEIPAKSVAVHSNKTKAPNFQTKIEDPALEASLRDKYSKVSGLKKTQRHNKRGLNFKASIKNYAWTSGLGFDEYHSYQISGTTQAGGLLSFGSSSTDVSISELRFIKAGNFIIDTAPWANIYLCNGHSGSIDFSKFVKTTVSDGDKLTTSGGVTFSKIILRREILGV